MSFLKDLTKENLKQFGIQGLSFTMPATTQKLVDSSSPAVTYNASELTLSSSDNWLAPFSGILNKVNATDKKIRFSLQKADGSMVNETGALLRLFPQQILRLKRLLAVKFEENGTHNPERGNGIAKRQAPAFIFIEDSGADSITEGIAPAGTDLGLSGKLSFYDEQGYILHPLYVTGLIKSLLALYPALNIDTALSDQLTGINSQETANTNTVRLVQADGRPYEGEHIEGLTAIDTNIGHYSVNTYSGGDTSLKGEITKAATDSSFTTAQARQLVLGNVCYGRMGDSVPLLKFPTALSAPADHTPAHDFHTIKVIALNKYLKGTPAAAFNGTKLEPEPALRMHEQLTLLSTGNAVMGQLSEMLAGSPSETLCVATAIDNKLVLPQDGSGILWPAFPALPAPGTVAEENNTFPTGLKEQIRVHSRADFVPPASGTPTDVLLQLNGIPFGASVRVFNRVFGNDATLKRGNGAGGVCTSEATPVSGRTLNGTLSLMLKDPLGLKRPDGTTTTVPTNPQLIVDIMIVLHNRKKRLFGAVSLPVQSSPGTLPTKPDNILAGLGKKSISSAGILGLGNNISSFSFATVKATINAALSLSGEANPREAARLPTMARRDLLAAAKQSGKWRATLSGGQINGNLHNAEQDLGCPGTPGGAETANAGVYTQDAQLAYDIARASFKRTNNIYDRIAADGLVDEVWSEPAANTALTESEQSSDSKGTFAAALLQNISPYCETPELALLKEAVEGEISSIVDFASLTSKLATWINDLDTTLLPTPLDNAAARLKSELRPRLNTLAADGSLTATAKERLYNELKRELSASCFGRRDSQWALQQALKQARHSIYIETPGFSFTKGTDDADYAVDLIAELTTQLSEKPGLRVILCVPRQPDYTYDQWLASEVKERLTIIEALPTEQLVVFHPIGFPGRPSNLEQTTIIIDDQWALCGSSAFRRRGFCFDGSTDLVFTDLETKNGMADSLQELRRQLLGQRLGIAAAEKSSRALLAEDFNAAFLMIRQMLIAGGLGKIDRLWNGHTEGVTYAEPTINKELANPDGITFNLMEASVFAAFEDMAK